MIRIENNLFTGPAVTAAVTGPESKTSADHAMVVIGDHTPASLFTIKGVDVTLSHCHLIGPFTGPAIELGDGAIVDGLTIMGRDAAIEHRVRQLVDQPRRGRRWWQLNLWRRTWYAIARFALRRL